MESVLAIATIVGPILLLGAIIWAWLRNRQASRTNKLRAEHGARELRKDIEDSPQKDADL